MQLAPGQRPLVVALGMWRCRVKAGTAWPSGFHGSNEGWKPTWQEMGGYGSSSWGWRTWRVKIWIPVSLHLYFFQQRKGCIPYIYIFTHLNIHFELKISTHISPQKTDAFSCLPSILPMFSEVLWPQQLLSSVRAFGASRATRAPRWPPCRVPWQLHCHSWRRDLAGQPEACDEFFSVGGEGNKMCKIFFASGLMKRMLQHLMFCGIVGYFHTFSTVQPVLHESVVYSQMAIVRDLETLKPRWIYLNLVEPITTMCTCTLKKRTINNTSWCHWWSHTTSRGVVPMPCMAVKMTGPPRRPSFMRPWPPSVAWKRRILTLHGSQHLWPAFRRRDERSRDGRSGEV